MSWVPFWLFCHLLCPAPSSWRGCYLPAWTLLKQQPFCCFHGLRCLLFPLSLAKIPKAPTLCAKTSLPLLGAWPAQSSLSFGFLERPFFYKASKALEPEPKVAWNEFTSTFLNAEKPRGTGACVKGHCSFSSNYLACTAALWPPVSCATDSLSSWIPRVVAASV